MDHLLKWNKQVNYITGRVCHKLTMLNRDSKFLSSSVLLRIYKQTILPIFYYGCIVWGDCGKGNAKRLERLQNKAMRIILNANRKTCSQEMRIKLNLLSLESRRRFYDFNLFTRSCITLIVLANYKVIWLEDLKCIVDP